MAPQWIPQNIQKRLLRYVLQQLSLFSEINLSDLDVSLGYLNLKNVLLNPECFKIPGMFLRSGKIANMNLNLTVSDGIVINGNDIEVILVLASSKGSLVSPSRSTFEHAQEFSLARSRADLASSVMPHEHGDEVSSDDDISSTSSCSEKNEADKKPMEGNTFYSSYVNKAVELALSKLQFNVTNVIVKVIISESSNGLNHSQADSFFILIDSVSWNYENEKDKAVNIVGFKIFTEKENKTKKSKPSPSKKSNKSNNLDSVPEEANGLSSPASDNYDSDNEDYSQMMTSSFLPAKQGKDSNILEDSDDNDDAMFMSANSHMSQTMMMTLNKLRESEQRNEEPAMKSSDMEKERLIKSIYETATGRSSVLDSNFKRLVHSNSEHYSTILSSSDVENRVYYLSISSIVVKFVGLLEIENLDILVDQLNVSFKTCEQENPSLFDIILNFVKQFDKASKLNSYLARRNNAKLRNYSNLASGSSVTIGKAKPSHEKTESLGTRDTLHWFSKLKVKQLAVALEAFVLPDGLFEQASDNYIFRAFDINIVRKNPYLVYGGIESILLENNSETLFEFRNDEGTEGTDGEDLRFEYLVNLATHKADITVLCSKVAELELGFSVVVSILNKVYRIMPILDAVSKLQNTLEQPPAATARQPGSLASSLIFQKYANNNYSSTCNLVTVQTNSVHGKIYLQEKSGLYVDILPLDYNSQHGKLVIPKIIISQITNKEIGKSIGTLSKLTLTHYPKHHQITSFDVSNKETVYLAESVLEINSVTLENTLVSFSSLVSNIELFSKQIMQAVDSPVIPQDPETLLARNNRKVRLSNTVYLNSNSNIKLHVKIAKLKASVTDINKLFGDIVGHVSNIHVNIFTDSAMQLLVNQQLFVMRVSDKKKSFVSEDSLDGKNSDGLEQIASMSNPENIALPLIGIKFANGNGRGFVRNLKIEYYASWLSMFEAQQEQTAKQEEKKQVGSNETKTSIKLRLVDCVIGLNPSRLHSKAMLLVDRGNVDVYIGNELFVKSQLRNISLLLIDDVKNVLGYNDTRKHRQWMTNKRHGSNSSLNSIPSWSQLSWHLSRGFISVGTINSLNMLIIKNSEAKLKKMTGHENAVLDLKIDADVCKIEVCADSSQALTQLLVDLKQPIVLSDEQKFSVSPGKDLDVFANVDENAFAPEVPDNGFTEGLQDTVLLEQRDESDEEIANEPINIVDDYYATSHSSSQNEDLVNQNLANLNIRTGSGLLSNNFSETSSKDNSNSLEDTSNDERSSFSFRDNHFTNISGSSGYEFSTVPMKLHFLLNTGNIEMYDGYDWPETRQAIKKAVRMVENTGLKAYTEVKKQKRRDSLGDFGFRPFEDEIEEDEMEEDEDLLDRPNVIDQQLYDSIHISLPVGANPEGLASGINRALGNSTSSKREAELIPDNKTNYKKLKLHRSKHYKLHVDLRDLEVDCVVFNNDEPDCQFTGQTSEEDDSELLSSVNVKVRDLEIVDNVPTSTWNKFATYMREAGDREVGVSMFLLEMQTYRPAAGLAATESVIRTAVLPLRLHVDQDTLEFLTRFTMFKDKRFMFDAMYDDILYVQRFQINSVHLKLDYKPKKIDYFGIRSGNTTEFINFFILDGARITLKKLVLHGIAGLPKLHEALNAWWMPDIRSTQIKGIISGLTPSLSKIGGGVKDLVVIPVNEYKKDGRLVNSLQKGAYAFFRTTTNELLRFGVKVAAGTQTILENTEEALGGTGSSARLPKQTKKYEVQLLDEEDYYDRIKRKSKKRVTEDPGMRISTEDVPGEFSVLSDFVSSPKTARKRKQKGTTILHSAGNSSVIRGNGRYYSEVYSDPEDDDDQELDFDSEYDDDSAESLSSEQQKTVSLYADQPVNMQEGVALAYTSFGRNVVLAKDAMVTAGGDAADSGSAKKALYVIVKAAPVALIRPMIGTTEAISKTLLGVTNQINPEQKLDAKEKYKPFPK